MHNATQTNDPAQQQLIEALRDPNCYPHAAKSVRLMETHISWVLQAGRYAYKIKKAIDLGFLDFTDLGARHFYCEEEIRLNRRLAPQLYLGVVAIGGSPQQPKLEISPAIEYAVKMRRFAIGSMLNRLLVRGLVTTGHIDQLSSTIARFHASLPSASPDSAFGTLDAIHNPAIQNFEQLLPLLNSADAKLLNRLHIASESEYVACVPLFERRRQEGWIRECHGDLHLGNIVLIKDEPTPFDGIEFNAGFRWIDVMNEVAFLVMDLLDHNRADLAFRFLNGYLELPGDYQGVAVLRFYLAYRAMVRAKVSAIRAHQADSKPHETQQAMAACRSYLTLTADCLKRQQPALVITHGLPGCGKTTVAQTALEQLQAIRIRSDVERKRLFGLAPLQASGSQAGTGIYGTEATRQTYDRLHQLARELLDAGFPVIVDAAFLKRAERNRFSELARAMAVPFVILSVRAEASILRQRILQRMAQAKDASEADLAVLETLINAQEPLASDERARSVELVNEGDLCDIVDQAAWSRLITLTSSTIPQYPTQDPT
jgi:aminoglycoside phosphotransferase family enzyme/predicted kinase